MIYILFLGLAYAELLGVVSGRTLEEHYALLNRNKRYLTFTYGSAIGMFVAFAVPVEDLDDRDLIFSYNFEANYNLPTNLSMYDLSPFDRSFYNAVNRTSIYDMLQRRLNSMGIEGRECLLRTICEASRYPLHHNGVIGHILHVVLTPSSSEEENLTEEEEAEERGKETNEECNNFYNCPIDLLSYISHYADEEN